MAHKLRASATGTEVTVTFRRRARQIRKSYVPRREKVPREARPKIYVPRREKAPREARLKDYVSRRETVPREARLEYATRSKRAPREAWPTNHDEGERGHCHR